jgi:hypothetical protein
VPQLVVVDQIFVAKGDAEYPLRHHGRDRVLHLCLRASLKQAANRPTRPIVRCVAPSSIRPASEVLSPPSNAATTWRPLDHFEQIAATLCRHRDAPLRQLKSLWYKSYARSEPRCTYSL